MSNTQTKCLSGGCEFYGTKDNQGYCTAHYIKYLENVARETQNELDKQRQITSVSATATPPPPQLASKNKRKKNEENCAKNSYLFFLSIAIYDVISTIIFYDEVVPMVFGSNWCEKNGDDYCYSDGTGCAGGELCECDSYYSECERNYDHIGMMMVAIFHLTAICFIEFGRTMCGVLLIINKDTCCDTGLSSPEDDILSLKSGFGEFSMYC